MIGVESQSEFKIWCQQLGAKFVSQSLETRLECIEKQVSEGMASIQSLLSSYPTNSLSVLESDIHSLKEFLSDKMTKSDKWLESVDSLIVKTNTVSDQATLIAKKMEYMMNQEHDTQDIQHALSEIKTRIGILMTKSSQQDIPSVQLDRPSKQLIVSMNDKVIQLSKMTQHNSESQSTRLSALEEKIKHFCLGNTQKEQEEQTKVNAELLVKLSKLSRDSSYHYTNTENWFQRLYDHQVKGSKPTESFMELKEWMQSESEATLQKMIHQLKPESNSLQLQDIPELILKVESLDKKLESIIPTLTAVSSQETLESLNKRLHVIEKTHSNHFLSDIRESLDSIQHTCARLVEATLVEQSPPQITKLVGLIENYISLEFNRKEKTQLDIHFARDMMTELKGVKQMQMELLRAMQTK